MQNLNFCEYLLRNIPVRIQIVGIIRLKMCVQVERQSSYFCHREGIKRGAKFVVCFSIVETGSSNMNKKKLHLIKPIESY